MTAPGLGSWIERRARRAPGAVAMLVASGAVTYGALAGRIRALAAELAARGILPGDRVAYHGGNHPAALVSVFATAALGAIWAPIHPARPEDEVRAILNDATPRLLDPRGPRDASRRRRAGAGDDRSRGRRPTAADA